MRIQGVYSMFYSLVPIVLMSKSSLLICSSMHRPLEHGSVRGLGWSVGVKVPGIQITPAEASGLCSMAAEVGSTPYTETCERIPDQDITQGPGRINAVHARTIGDPGPDPRKVTKLLGGDRTSGNMYTEYLATRGVSDVRQHSEPQHIYISVP
jgi:hypothetical protein